MQSPGTHPCPPEVTGPTTILAWPGELRQKLEIEFPTSASGVVTPAAASRDGDALKQACSR